MVPGRGRQSKDIGEDRNAKRAPVSPKALAFIGWRIFWNESDKDIGANVFYPICVVLIRKMPLSFHFL